MSFETTSNMFMTQKKLFGRNNQNVEQKKLSCAKILEKKITKSGVRTSPPRPKRRHQASGKLMGQDFELIKM